jgi:hypothetical protein
MPLSLRCRHLAGSWAGSFALIILLPTADASASSLLAVDQRKIVSRADLSFNEPTNRSEEGLPVGTGRMGSLVWTSPSSLKLQINRVDVFANNGATNSFPERHSDYSNGCASVDVDFVDFGEDVFVAPEFSQCLSVYEGIVATKGKGVATRVVASQDRDVIAIEVEDSRERPTPVSVDLRMLRYQAQFELGRNFDLTSQHATVMRTRNQTATSRLHVLDQRIALTQSFDEGSFHCASGVAISIVGRDAKAKYVNETTVRLSAAGGKGRFTILIGSAASFDPKADLAQLAAAEVVTLEKTPFEQVLAGNRGWWDEFWKRSFVFLRSKDGTAEQVEQAHTYLLYLMASSSRGAFPPRFGGLIWSTNADLREWGAQYWWHNTSCYYDALRSANHDELLAPVFSMYNGMADNAARAAREQWGSAGIFVPETTTFDGLPPLPDDIAAEMRDLYLGRKPWEQRSYRFKEFAYPKTPHSSRWNWKGPETWQDGILTFNDKGRGAHGQVLHIFSSQAKIAHLYWVHYENTLDGDFLRTKAYPFIKGVAEFYRNYPNLKKGEDGKYHIYDVNNHEPVWGAQDTSEEITGLRGILPLAIRGAAILGVDPELAAKWRELLENMAPFATNAMAGSPVPRAENEPIKWVVGLNPIWGKTDVPGIAPLLNNDIVTIATKDPELLAQARASFDATYPNGFGPKTPARVLNRNGIAAAHLGRGDILRYMLPNQLNCLEPETDFCDWDGVGRQAVLRNRLTLREGPGAIDAQRLGRVSEAMQLGLMQSVPANPGEDAIIHVFAAWPKEWDAAYTLRARGGFLVSSSQRAGVTEFVEIDSELGSFCQLKNPWPYRTARLYRDGQAGEELSGPLFSFRTKKGENLVIVPSGSDLERFKRSLLSW